MVLVQKEIKKVTIRPNGSEVQIRPVIPPYLCFTANTAGSTVRLFKVRNPTAVTLETSTDGQNWSTYTMGDVITLSNIGDKIYFRNTSETTTGFSFNGNNYYRFIAGDGSNISASGDVTYLINKNGTKTLTTDNCFNNLFSDMTALVTAPELNADVLTQGCYRNMFMGCTNLETLPKLKVNTLAHSCYYYMFTNCSKIKISATQTGEYQTEYRIPITGTGTTAQYALNNMFTGTGGTFTGTPTINTTYYTSNTVV